LGGGWIHGDETRRVRKLVRSEDQTLVKEKPFVKYDQLIERAEVEGRIGGKYRCLVCGMRYHAKDDADDCCRVVE